MIDCIYCCTRGPCSREHVLQKNLGGNLMAPIACVSCNTGFSQIDQALAEQSIVALERVCRTPARHRVRLGNLHFVYYGEGDLWEDVQITNGLLLRVPPQLHFRNSQIWFFAGNNDDKNHFLTSVRTLIETDSLPALFVRIGPGKFCTTARLVQHRYNDMFIHARTRDEGEEFRRILPKIWTEVEAVLRNEMMLDQIVSPSVNAHMSIDHDHVYRAIAKIAFNYLAVRKGVEFARRPEFDLIRNYIRGLDVRPSQPKTGGVAVDRRFVRCEKPGVAPLVPTTQHLVMLGYSYPNVCAIITLYGKHTFVVFLGEMQLQSGTDLILEAHEFSLDSTVNHPLDMLEIARRMYNEANSDDEVVAC